MSKIILFVGGLLIIVNTVFGLLISKYSLFNCFSVNAVLLINTMLIFFLLVDKISTGNKISLLFVFSLLCFTSVVFAILSPELLKDNFYFIGFILIVALEILLFLIVKNIKLVNKKNGR